MPALASQFVTVPRSRLRALVVPREHGAWGMLLVPLATGAAVGIMRGGQALPLLLFLLAAMSVFWLRTPLESWLGTTPLRAQTVVERRALLVFILCLSAVAALMFTALFWGGQNRAYRIQPRVPVCPRDASQARRAIPLERRRTLATVL